MKDRGVVTPQSGWGRGHRVRGAGSTLNGIHSVLLSSGALVGAILKYFYASSFTNIYLFMHIQADIFHCTYQILHANKIKYEGHVGGPIGEASDFSQLGS